MYQKVLLLNQLTENCKFEAFGTPLPPTSTVFSSPVICFSMKFAENEEILIGN